MMIKTIILILVTNELSHVLSSNDAKLSAVSDQDRNFLCAEEKCIMKCCSFGKFLNTIKIFKEGRDKPTRKRICDVFNNTTRDIYDLENEDIFFNRPILSSFNFTVKAGIFEANETFMTISKGIANIPSFNMYITEYPKVFLEHPNAYQRWTEIPNNRFCWDYTIKKSKDGSKQTLKPGVWAIFINSEELSRTTFDVVTSAMLVSCFFLVVVLVVYGVLPELRNLCGQILMAYVASLLGAFLLLASIRIRPPVPVVCLGLTYVIYYLLLASFCWMNVMSYDIWWTFRGYAKARPIHRRGERFKFLMYCLYAFGLPLSMTILLAVFNHMPLSHKPWIVTPKIPDNGCFIEGGEKLLYLYIPMLILILCNWMFYLMTAFNIWRLSRGTAVLDSAAAGTPQAHRSNRQRFLIYLKLSVVMGLNWVLEVISYKFPSHSVWFISDFYNILIGVSIFLIFVCKRKILRKLGKRYLRFKSAHWQPSKVVSKRSSSLDSSSGNETQSLQVCSNPKGPAYTMKYV